MKLDTRKPDVFCPVCGIDLPEQPASCMDCETDLSGWWRVYFRPFVYANQACDLAEEENFEAAVPLARLAVEMHPLQSDLRLLLARLLSRVEHLEEAIDQVASALEITPDHQESKTLYDELAMMKFEKTNQDALGKEKEEADE